ncbi:COP9 signalosome complex subunit 5 [Ceratobasidium theobromae]|uniref:COP9 signalosome complex subunit 5 n=1 Tax=Ceratobasidium theobromae TaxID=1582974 RepID=A0A5N5QDU5_9AGAM|nr:COP9 signalosome complex subunit 5 [Ceratobasidium theobromae]
MMSWNFTADSPIRRDDALITTAMLYIPSSLCVPRPDPRPTVTEYCSKAADTLLVSYYRLALALIHGCQASQRPSLPTELVLHIFRLARLASPHPNKALSTRYACSRPVAVPLFCGFFKLAQYPLGLATLVTTSELPSSVRRIQVMMTTRWSDFFVRVVRSVDVDETSRRKWPCFESKAIVSDKGALEAHRTFDDRDAVWSFRTGDRLEVVVQAYAGEVQVDKFDAVVRPRPRMQADTALKTFSLANDVREVDVADEMVVYDKVEAARIDKEAPWKKDPHYFKRVHISVIALIKMVIHARSGGIYEIMGMMQGKIRASDQSLVVLDSFALPVQGTETRVNAANEANEYMVAFKEGATGESGGMVPLASGVWVLAVGHRRGHAEHEPAVPRPVCGCCGKRTRKRSKVTTGMQIDPNRTISAGKVDIGAFRTFPADYKAPATETTEYQSIPLSKIEDFGVHASSYYPLEVSVFKTRLDNELLNRLWNKYWVNTLSQSPLISNRAYAVSQLTDLGAKLAKAQGGLSQRGSAHGALAGGLAGDRSTDPRQTGIPEEMLRKGKGKDEERREESALGKAVKDSTKIAREAQHGLIAQVLKDIVFGARAGQGQRAERVAGVVGGALVGLSPLQPAMEHIASYPQLQLIQRHHRIHRPLGAPAHGTIGTFADLAAAAALPTAAALAQRVGGRTDPLFNPQNTSNVYINGLPTFFSTAQLYDLCAEFGTITSVRTFDRLNTPEPSTYGFVLFADMEAARRCIVALRQYSDLHPSFAKVRLIAGCFWADLVQTQKIPQPSADAQVTEAFEKRMERLSLFDGNVPSRDDDAVWRTRVASAPGAMQCNPRPRFARSPLETVPEDPAAVEAQADVFIQGLPLHLQPGELEALFVPHKILDNRVCQVAGDVGLPDSISGVMRLASVAAARQVERKLHGLQYPGWPYSLKVMVIDNHGEDDNVFRVQPGRAPSTAGQWPSIGLGVPIRTGAFSARRIVSMPVGTMASMHAPSPGIPLRSPTGDVRDPIYSTKTAVGSERSSPIGSERHVALQLDAAFSPRPRSGSGSDGSMSPVSPALTFTSAGRTPTMATIATPRHDDESKNIRGEGEEAGLKLCLGGIDGQVTALTVGLAGLDD